MLTCCTTSHSNDLIEMIKGSGTASKDQLRELSGKHDSVYFSKVRNC